MAAGIFGVAELAATVAPPLRGLRALGVVTRAEARVGMAAARVWQEGRQVVRTGLAQVQREAGYIASDFAAGWQRGGRGNFLNAGGSQQLAAKIGSSVEHALEGYSRRRYGRLFKEKVSETELVDRLSSYSGSRYVGWHQTELSWRTTMERVRSQDFTGNNYAALRYGPGADDILVASSANLHSEKMLFKALTEKFSGKQFADLEEAQRYANETGLIKRIRESVTELHTEREPCGPKGCSTFLQDVFPNAQVTHSVPYYKEKMIRDEGNLRLKNVLRELKQLFKN